MREALAAAQRYRDDARVALAARLEAAPIDSEQRAAHGFAWVATTVAALEAVHDWAARDATDVDTLVARLAFQESIAQLVGGLPMGQNELFRPTDLGLAAAARALATACADLLLLRGTLGNRATVKALRAFDSGVERVKRARDWPVVGPLVARVRRG